MTEWKKYQNRFLDECGKVIGAGLHSSTTAGETLHKQLFSREKIPIPARELSPAEEHIGRLFSANIEIHSTVRTLEDIQIYVRNFPYSRNAKIEKHRYLQYHLESYFGEIFILRERLIAFLNVLKKTYKFDTQETKNTNELIDMVKTSLKTVTKTRSLHVHEKRFVDYAIDRLSAIKLLQSMPNKEQRDFMQNYYKLEYNFTRRKWINTLQVNQKELDKLLDLYGSSVSKLIFNRSKKLKYPVPIERVPSSA